jgi:DUF1680 family protein
MGAAGLGGLSLVVSPALALERGDASRIAASATANQRMASHAASRYRSYRSKTSGSANVLTWVQVDLGSSRRIDAVRLYPGHLAHWPAGDGFPVRFRIECSASADFESGQTIIDQSDADFPFPGDRITEFRSAQLRARYVRVTATRLREQMPSALKVSILPEALRREYLESIRGVYFFDLAKIEVLDANTDIAVGRAVSVDPEYGNPADAQQLTRPLRQQGEGIVTDNVRNVMPRKDWKPVAFAARAPQGGVELRGGLLLSAMQHNIRYLLNSSPVVGLLSQFRRRAGKPVSASAPVPHPFWDVDLAGSSAGRFLMGAGNTLRWVEEDELRRRLQAVVDGIAECRQANGYIMAYPEDGFFVSERGAYTRAWLTHGLIDAGYAGSSKAFELLRGYYDWFNSRPFLNEALRACNQGGQGMVANTRMHFTPAGRPADIEVVQRYFQENYWLDDLAERRTDALGQYPYDRAHAYLLTNLEAYLDLYRATGSQRYLQAVLGAWELFRRDWQYVGGSFSLIEYQDCVPRANPLHGMRGETCGNAFWIGLNHRLHLLDPSEEKYVAEIERSIYNVLLANQVRSEGIRYHSVLIGRKGEFTCMNTCCEGQATRILASLPEYVYSLADDGIYVNLFERSNIEWRISGETLRLDMQTDFPNRPDVKLIVTPKRPTQTRIHIRVPSWASAAMRVDVNGQRAASGAAGTYVSLSRVWSPGDVITFELPVQLTATRYTGVDRSEGRERYALEYGPILMAALAEPDADIIPQGVSDAVELVSHLEKSSQQRLHFMTAGTSVDWVPYFEVDAESFSCFPSIKVRQA